jgi:hypothetical protein
MSLDVLLWRLLPERLYRKLKDRCETCGGTRGGVRGNENVVQSCGERVVMCDYCHADELRYLGFWNAECEHYFESWNDTCRYCGAVKSSPQKGVDHG